LNLGFKFLDFLFVGKLPGSVGFEQQGGL